MELAELQRLTAAKLSISPGPSPGNYVVRPSSVVGSATTPALQVVIAPKVGVERVLFLLGYARRLGFQPESVQLGSDHELVEAFVASFLTMLQRAMRRGLLMGYVAREEAVPLVRGRIRLADQIRRRQGLPLPIEIVYDDYTEDTEENRLLKAALRRLAYVRFRRPSLRRRVHEALDSFQAVSDVSYSAQALPAFQYTRLTERYRVPLELACLILRNASVELLPGRTTTSGVLFNMNTVFEDFVFQAIGDQLRALVPSELRWRQGKQVRLDVRGHVKPEPDLSLWSRSRCVFVGDAKYKETQRGEVDDLYQALAYCVSTGLTDAMLVYANAPRPVMHQVTGGGPRLHVEILDVGLPRQELLSRCGELAARVARFARVEQSAAASLG